MFAVWKGAYKHIYDAYKSHTAWIFREISFGGI